MMCLFFYLFAEPDRGEVCSSDKGSIRPAAQESDIIIIKDKLHVRHGGPVLIIGPVPALICPETSLTGPVGEGSGLFPDWCCIKLPSEPDIRLKNRAK